MSDSFWEENEEMADEGLSEQAPQEASNSEIYEDGGLLDEDPEDVFSDVEVLKNARLRLEQGRLYEMLLKHDLFEGVDADQKAIQNVQREIRAFIKERLEILVGLKQDPRSAKKAASGLEIFSDVELQVLKQFVAKVTGSTESPPALANKPTPVRQPAKSTGLRPVSKHQQSKPQRQKNATEKEAPRLTKPPSQMTIEELKQYNKGIAERQAAKKPTMPLKRMPMPDSQQLTNLYASRVQADPGNSLVGVIMAKMGKSVGVIENVGDGGIDSSDNDSRM